MILTAESSHCCREPSAIAGCWVLKGSDTLPSQHRWGWSSMGIGHRHGKFWVDSVKPLDCYRCFRKSCDVRVFLLASWQCSEQDCQSRPFRSPSSPVFLSHRVLDIDDETDSWRFPWPWWFWDWNTPSFHGRKVLAAESQDESLVPAIVQMSLSSVRQNMQLGGVAEPRATCP